MIFTFFKIRGSVWTEWDYKVLDMVYRQAVQYGYGPQMSHQIVYLTITDGSYNYFGKNILDRADLAKVNDVLSDLNIEALAYDIIFARPSLPESDYRFKSSIHNLGSVYLPIGLDYSESKKSFRWEDGTAYERFRSDHLVTPIEKGLSNPFYATNALMQTDNFSEVAYNSGDISAHADPDGVYRHIIMLLKVDDKFFPTLTLSMFLDHVGISSDEIIVYWGEKIIIPALKGSYLDSDIIIPIDNRGRAYIPFAQVWEKDFKKMAVHTLLENFKDEDLRGNLTDFFEGKFVFVGDVSIGTSDLGQTPIEGDTPLIITQASLLNGLLTNTFYSKITFWNSLIFIWVLGVILGLSAFPKSSWLLYITGAFILVALIGLIWVFFIQFRLFPIVTTGSSLLFLFIILIVGIEVTVSKERAFIKNTFSRYVPEKVVTHLLATPELLKLGGEERVITVLFSDLADFTTISEKMTPPDLVHLLNEYLTEMTNVVLEEGGIIDKYQGDAIMAEFGVPIHVPDHADMAVRTGLRMQQRLKELRQEWEHKELPMLHCRVGINTGPMIIGNIGSKRVFDYTVIGDAVNLASRLEGANKRYGTFLMISESTYENLTPGIFKARILDFIKVKGKLEPIKVFEVYGETSELSDQSHDLYYQTYHNAFEAYLSKQFSFAHTKFLEALAMRTEDIASKEMVDRIDKLNFDELPNDWDGSVALTSK
ncbi:CHASE2 domain-containing protein [Thermodesulfobacteriota bacterium]